jgi:hypothetical protein
MNAKMVEIAHAMGAKAVNPFPGYGNYDVTRYQSTHLQGGTIMATSPDRAGVNMHQQYWDISNLFVIGASTFPNSGAANPTPHDPCAYVPDCRHPRGKIFQEARNARVRQLLSQLYRRFL